MPESEGRTRGASVRAGGVVIDHTGGRLTARFDGPARAIRHALAVIDEAPTREQVRFRAGIHTGECELTPNGVRGVPLSMAAELAARAAPGEVLTTGTVRDLVVGSGIEFDPRGVHRLAGAPSASPIFAATGIEGARDGTPRPSAGRAHADLRSRGPRGRSPGPGRESFRAAADQGLQVAPNRTGSGVLPRHRPRSIALADRRLNHPGDPASQACGLTTVSLDPWDHQKRIVVFQRPSAGHSCGVVA